MAHLCMIYNNMMSYCFGFFYTGGGSLCENMWAGVSECVFAILLYVKM